MTTSRPAALAAIALAATLGLAACGAAEPAVNETHATVDSPAPVEEPSADPEPLPVTEPTAVPAEYPTPDSITCDGMLEPLFAQALRSVAIIPAPKPWDAFNFVPTGAALACPWGYEGDMHSQAYYTWAKLGPGEKDAFIAKITANDYGYEFEETERGTWVVIPDDGSGAPEGLLVTDEWAAMAPTRELIDVMTWAR